MAIPGSESSGGSPRGSSPGSAAFRAVSPFARASYGRGDSDEDEELIDPEDLWAPMGTPIPPATSKCYSCQHYQLLLVGFFLVSEIQSPCSQKHTN